MSKPQALSAADTAKLEAGMIFGIDMLNQVPKDCDRVMLEAHITGVLIVFWGALWGTFGTEYARGFIESQLRGMEPDCSNERFTPPSVQ
jgi:hypothetical protein